MSFFPPKCRYFSYSNKTVCPHEVWLFWSENEKVRKYTENRLILSWDKTGIFENYTRIFWMNNVWSWKLHILYTPCSLRLVFCFSLLQRLNQLSLYVLCRVALLLFFPYCQSLYEIGIFCSQVYEWSDIAPFSPQKPVILPFLRAQVCKTGSSSTSSCSIPQLNHPKTHEQPCILLPPLLWMKKMRLKF